MDFPDYNLHRRYHADDCLNNTLGNLDVRMVEIGYTPNASPWLVLGKNCDPWFRLYYMTETSAYLLLQDKRVEIKPGRLYLIPPRLPFQYALSSLAAHVWLHFFSDTLQQALPSEIFSVPFDKMELLQRVMANAVIGAPDTTESTVEVNLLCRMLLNEFFRCPEFLVHTQTLGIPMPLRRVAEYIRQNCDAKISIQELAALARMTQVQFTRQFAKYYHQTPKEYCCNARVDHAKTLLMQTELSTKEIAERCGFSDCYHFYHQFKKSVAMTPSEYRECNKVRH